MGPNLTTSSRQRSVEEICKWPVLQVGAKGLYIHTRNIQVTNNKVTSCTQEFPKFFQVITIGLLINWLVDRTKNKILELWTSTKLTLFTGESDNKFTNCLPLRLSYNFLFPTIIPTARGSLCNLFATIDYRNLCKFNITLNAFFWIQVSEQLPFYSWH